jgi:AcrR family transcriptional regulator
MARPKTQLNRRNDIIETSQILFAQKGFENTTIDEIAKCTGIGKGSVYLEFKTKEEILSVIVDSFASVLLEKEELKINNAKPPYLQLFKEITLQSISDVFNMAHSYIHTHFAQMNTSYNMKQTSGNVVQKFVNNNALLLKKAQDNGEISPHYDNLYLANLIFIVLQAFHPPYDFKYSLEKRTDLTKEAILELLLKDASDILEILLSGLKTATYTDDNL